MLFVFIACDKNESTQPNEPATTTVSVDVTYNVADMYDLAKILDLKVVYTDKDGKEKQEIISATPWKKTWQDIQSIKLDRPTTLLNAKLKLVYTRKPDFQNTQASYKIGKGFWIAYNLNIAGAPKQGGTPENPSTLTVGKDKIEDYITKFLEAKHEDSVTISVMPK